MWALTILAARGFGVDHVRDRATQRADRLGKVAVEPRHACIHDLDELLAIATMARRRLDDEGTTQRAHDCQERALTRLNLSTRCSTSIATSSQCSSSQRAGTFCTTVVDVFPQIPWIREQFHRRRCNPSIRIAFANTLKIVNGN
jgi:hypothetical protein